MSESKRRLEAELRDLRAENQRLTAQYVVALAGDAQAEEALFDSIGAKSERIRCVTIIEDLAKAASTTIVTRPRDQKEAIVSIRSEAIVAMCGELTKLIKREDVRNAAATAGL